MAIDIIGAGIGGLSLALALKQKDIPARIFERTPTIRSKGAGIMLAINAMQVYQKLGIKDQIEALGAPIHHLNITNAKLKPISTIDLAKFETQYGVKSIAIHRSALQHLLLEQLPLKQIYLNRRLTSITTGNELSINFSDGSSMASSALVGADGIRSVVRQQIFPNAPFRDAHMMCWRGVVPFELPAAFKGDLFEAWGAGARFGMVEIGANQVYWYAVVSTQKLAKHKDSPIEAYFKDFNPVIQDLIRLTHPANIHADALYDLKPIDSWVESNICLMGDAAHATTPNLGQGACQAIEDAYILSNCLQKYPVKEAFQQFENIRKEKAQLIVKTSWNIGQLAHLQQPFLMRLRNTIIKWTPSKLRHKLNHKLFELEKIK